MQDTEIRALHTQSTRPFTWGIVGAGAIAHQVGPSRRVVDSAATTARATAAALESRGLASRTGNGRVTLLATDSPERFARVGARFLGSSIAERQVEIIDL